MNTRNLLQGAAAVLAAALLAACGDGGSNATQVSAAPAPAPTASPAPAPTPVATVSPAEEVLSAALLPPDGTVAAAQSLADEDLPPGEASGTTVAADELPPST